MVDLAILSTITQIESCYLWVRGEPITKAILTSFHLLVGILISLTSLPVFNVQLSLIDNLDIPPQTLLCPSSYHSTNTLLLSLYIFWWIPNEWNTEIYGLYPVLSPLGNQYLKYITCLGNEVPHLPLGRKLQSFYR